MRHLHSFTVRSAEDVAKVVSSGLQLHAIYPIISVASQLTSQALEMRHSTYYASGVSPDDSFDFLIRLIVVYEYVPIRANADKMLAGRSIAHVLNEIAVEFVGLSDE